MAQQQEFSYQILRSQRRTVAIQITGQGSVVVRCPLHMGEEAVRRFVDSKAAWIRKHLERRAAAPQSPKLSAAELEELTVRARQVFAQRVGYFAPLVGVTYGRITIRHQRSRWGSCSAKGNLNFNCLLLLAPPEVLDYVVVHELCHRKQMNHSPAFWAEVEKRLPDYRENRRWLRENGRILMEKC